ncbi:MAG: hypothetical protein HKO58_11710 [Gammaproteobacteria bacterium]|nr:hypothetical protein [Gammaproteobacteria bacterium]
MKRLFLISCLLLFFLSSVHVDAHTRSQSFSQWEIDEQSINVTFAVNARRVTQLAQLYNSSEDLDQLLKRHLQETLAVKINTEDCELRNISIVTRTSATMQAKGHFNCQQDINPDSDVNALVTAFQSVSPTQIHIARIQNDTVISEVVVREGRSSFALNAPTPTNDLKGFVSTGFTHVLSGLDHLVFLLALVLVASTPRTAIYCITGFTLGHSLSLGLVTIGWIESNERLVEALIGFTIAITALEAGVLHGLKRKRSMFLFAALTLIIIFPVAFDYSILGLGSALLIYTIATANFTEVQAIRLLPAITIAFGLIHGAGFAGGLQEATLFQSEILLPLLGFNIGVELAQLLALCVIYFAFWIIRKTSFKKLKTLQHYTSICAFGLGVFWFAQRVWI